MAISRHSTEWLSMMLVCGSLGVTFTRHRLTDTPPRKRYPRCWWRATLGKAAVDSDTKYGAAKALLEVLDRAKELDALLPDAAESGRFSTDPAAPGIELRSSR